MTESKLVQITVADAERLRDEVRSGTRTLLHILGMAVTLPLKAREHESEARQGMKETEELIDRLTIAIHEAKKP